GACVRAGRRGPAGRPPRAARPPEPLPADALDSHTHLDLIERPVPEVLADARAARITRVVTIGVDVATSRWAADCAAAHPGVYAAVAVHPNETARAAGGGPGRRGGHGRRGRGTGRDRLAGRPAPGPGGRRDRPRLLPRLGAARRAARLVPRARPDGQAGGQGPDGPRPGRARGRAAHPGRGGPAG